MREGWEYKELGEVAHVTDYVANGSFATLRENVKYMDKAGFAILVRLADYTNNFDSSKFVYVNEHAYNFLSKSKLFGGEIIMSNVGSIGKSFICPQLSMPMSLAPNSIMIRTSNNKFYFYYFNSPYFQSSLKKISSQTALPKFNKTQFKSLIAPIPPLSEQERIVSELDLLSSIIEKKRAQLKEYDQLAQSIFYDMFGDPVKNEKGWEQQPFYSICKSLFAGGDVPKDNFSKTKTEKYKVPIISNGINDKAIYGYTNIAKVEEESLTISGRGTIGYCAIRKEPFFPVIRLIVATPKQGIIIPIVLKYIIDSLNLKGEGVAIPQLTIPKVKNELIILPPLFLQQQFAEKTEAIEKQKELIMQSLTEMESLFNSRIDFWFNY